ncbi:isochorismate synthase MenF [Pseudoclavibacter sp. CFCC 13611]|uniref:isochorismate synthase n=1 Tax=Pseudoclavibacter sp. CFCC 13611 TaxID=2615178 RepID=UPI0013019599|nr:chorismate-binding protein [Pseudoclavibacter sp. CFCC 13611]KAB1662841.1 isochorismate synthase [Pseudoclavibacter sp. CFCC 13611]
MFQLTTRTVQVHAFDTPFPLLDAADPLLWWRDGEGMLGIGRALTLTFSGPERFDQARRVWKSVADSAHQLGAAAEPGTGLATFGAFAFDDAAAVPSVLVVPSLLITQRGGRTWATRVIESSAGASVDDRLDPDRIRAEVDHLLAASADRRAHRAADLAADSVATLHADADAPERHAHAVRRALDLIEHGTLQKVVVARSERASLPAGFDLPTVLQRLEAAYPSCWNFCVDGFFGASPETLVEAHRGRVHARVLAGTRPRDANPAVDDLARDLLTSSKDQHEHALAAQSLLDTLAPHVRDLGADGPFVLELPNVLHLATDVDAELADGADVLTLIAAVHPTAAVAGVPREASLQTISEIEGVNRGRYAGPVGWIDASGDGEWAIGLRSAQRIGSTITAWAGGGIVAGSVPEQEFAETSAKLQPIRQALAG